MTNVVAQQIAVSAPKYARHEELHGRVHVGPVDQLSAEQILALLPTHPAWPLEIRFCNMRTRGAGVLLAWLKAHPGKGWQERWCNAHGDDGLDWIPCFTAADPRAPNVKRAEVTSGLRGRSSIPVRHSP